MVLYRKEMGVFLPIRQYPSRRFELAPYLNDGSLPKSAMKVRAETPRITRATILKAPISTGPAQLAVGRLNCTTFGQESNMCSKALSYKHNEDVPSKGEVIDWKELDKELQRQESASPLAHVIWLIGNSSVDRKFKDNNSMRSR